MESVEVVAVLATFGVPDVIAHLVRDSVEAADGLGGRAHAWPTQQYVAVAADADSRVAAYVYPSGMSLVLDPDEARAAAQRDSFLSVDEKNGQTMILWARREAIEEDASAAVVRRLLERALIRSGSRARQARTPAAQAAVDRVQPFCPVHNVEMLGGSCDLCD